MNRNQYTRFSKNPANVNIERSSFDRQSQYKTTLSAGKLIPFFLDEVTAGDTFSLDTSFVCRMATPLFPVMDTAFLDKWYFFVPHRLLWDNWKAMNGEDDPSAWNTPTEYIAPMIKPSADSGFPAFSNADYFGLPTNVPNIEVNAMPFRALALIWNEFFRDQNLQQPLLVNKGASSGQDKFFAHTLFAVNKRHDYFTSALPSPQKGPSVLLPLTGFAPVIPMAEDWTADQLRLTDYNFPRFTSMTSGSYTNITGDSGNGGTVIAGSTGSSNMGLDPNGNTSGTDGLTFTNLGADGAGYEVTINAMRLAFAIQRIFERDARGGSRYREFIKNHFNVTMPDATAQIPEYLGGESDVINMSQVVQQSATVDGVSPQGNTAGLSKTVGRNHSFAKSFVEPGYIIGVMAVRTLHSYQQGIEKLWSRKSRFDWYLPALAHIGEQPILTKEIYATGNPLEDDSVFGYQEAWADYRYKPSRVTGAFRSNYSGGSLDVWHYADDYESRPFLSADWIKETSANIERTLVVEEELNPNTQFIVDLWLDLKCARPLPLYSIPGLLDHF